MNDDELGLPPRRELPDGIRRELRLGLLAEMDKPRRAFKVPAAVAAGVVLLVSGVVFVNQPAQRGHGVSGQLSAESPLPLDVAKANLRLDRCWAAVVGQGLIARYPDRSRWVPSFEVERDTLDVVAARAEGKPLFCETTRTTVTVSDPNLPPLYSPGVQVGTVLVSQEGVIAGVANVPWKRLRLTGGDDYSSDSRVSDNMFVAVTGIRALPTPRVSGDGSAEFPLPTNGPDPLAVVDRPTVPAPDRGSAPGGFLGECLQAVPEAVLDPDSYSARAYRFGASGRAVVGRSADHLVMCTADTGLGYHSAVSAIDSASTAMKVLDVRKGGPDGTYVVGGEVPDETTAARFTFAPGVTADAVVADGTFVATAPPSVNLGAAASVDVELYGASGNVLFDGLVPLR